MRRQILATVAAAAVLAAAIPATARVPAQRAAPNAVQAVDPAAVRALSAMSAYLRTLTSFEVRTQTTIEEVIDDDGGKVTYSGTGIYRVSRPGAFYVEVNTEAHKRQFWYDGKTFTVFMPSRGYYAQMTPAPATIRETLDRAYIEFGVALPLADIFNWGTDDLPPGEITRARLVQSNSVIGGVTTDHYAFSSTGLDWQLWIEKGATPLPRRVVITTVGDPAKPSYSADLTWQTQANFPAQTFAFQAPATARSITLARVEEPQQ